jgi:hypothetical protein
MNRRNKDYYLSMYSWLSEKMPEKSRYDISGMMDQLHRWETTLHRIAENDCNGHPKSKVEYRDGKMYRYDVEDEAWAARDAKKEASIISKINAMFECTPIKPDFNGDPRGGYIRLLSNGREMYIDW